MVRIPKASESIPVGHKMPDEGTYTAVVESIDPPVWSELYSNNQQLIKWKLLAMFDEDEEEWITEFPDKDAVVHDYVNVDWFFDGGGDSTRVSPLYKIAKALLGPDMDPEDAGDTDEFVGRRATIELLHGVKKMGPNAGKPKLVFASYKYIKRKNKSQAAPQDERPVTYDDGTEIPF